MLGRGQELRHGLSLAARTVGWLRFAELLGTLLDPPSDGPHDTAGLVAALLQFAVATLWDRCVVGALGDP
jgi:hypothetical protein